MPRDDAGQDLTIVYSDAGKDGERAVQDALDRWGPGERPGLRRVSLAEFLAPAGDDDAPPAEGAVVVVIGVGDAPTMRWKAADAIRRRVLAGVILAPDPQPAAPDADVPLLGWRVEPAFLAGTLRAMMARQPVLRATEMELRALSRMRGGVDGELARVHDELNLAAAVQRDMLPRRLPEWPGIGFATLFRPAGYVSGDIYDVQALDEHRAGFFIADAVGHGVPAALLTMIVSRSLRMVDHFDGGTRVVPPGESLARLNDELILAQRGLPRFATAAYGVVDSRTRRVTLAVAGHPPPLILSRGRTERVQVGGPLLGVFAGERFDEATFALEPGQTLLLYSDGFETAFRDPEARGPRRVPYAERLAAVGWPGTAGDLEPADSIARIRACLDAQAGSLHQADDITAVALTAVREGARQRCAA